MRSSSISLLSNVIVVVCLLLSSTTSSSAFTTTKHSTTQSISLSSKGQQKQQQYNNHIHHHHHQNLQISSLQQQKQQPYQRQQHQEKCSSTRLNFGIVDPQCIVDTVTTTVAVAGSSAMSVVNPTPIDLNDIFSANTQWLADSVASATADVAATSNEGWWNSYLNIFKGGLELVHSVVDKPLRGAGIEQTWGISIALFTLGIRLALVPLSIEQSKSSEYMKALKPYTKEINEKFAKNEQAKTRAIAKLYEDANQNPLSGCLLSLAQLPIFLGLYRGVRLLAIDGELQESFLWIPSLEGPVTGPDFRGLDWLVSGWVNGAPPLGWEATLAFLSMPLILVVLQSITMQTLQPPLDDDIGEAEKETLQRTQLALKFLPLLIGFFALQVPAGLTIYWFSSNIFTLTQSLAVKAYFAANPPKIELPNYWESALSGDADNMTPEERRKASEAGLSVGPTFDELIDQSRFHVYIDRMKMASDLKVESNSYQQIVQHRQGDGTATATSSSSSLVIPPEMEVWVEQSMKNVNMHQHAPHQQTQQTQLQQQLNGSNGEYSAQVAISNSAISSTTP